MIGKQADENTSEKLPKTDDEAKLLEPAIAELLQTIPDRWEKYEIKSLTSLQERSLFLLVAAGLVEQRFRFRISMSNQPAIIEATVTATGEYGLFEATQPIFDKAWNLWSDQLQEWNGGESEVAPFHCEILRPDEWRLTDQGIVGRNDLNGDKAQNLFDFVLKRGSFDGQLWRLPDGRLRQRLPVCGHGKLEDLTEVQQEPFTTSVNIHNWDVGAKAIADVLFLHFKTLQEQFGNASKPVRSKRSSEKGEAQAKLIAALTKHHEYADRGCLNQDPIGNNDLARLAGVSESTASAFFNKQFDGHIKYRAICSDARSLVTALKLLNHEFSPHQILREGAANERGRNDDE